MIAVLVFFLLLLPLAASNSNQEFIFLGQLKLNGSAEIQTNASFTLQTTPNPLYSTKGQVFYAVPFHLIHNSSFSTSFVFFINQLFPVISKEGISFMIASSKSLPHSFHGTDAQQDNIFSIQFLMNFSRDNKQADDNHLAISVNDATLIRHSPLNYYADVKNGGELKNVKLTGGEPIQAWVEYDGRAKELKVTLSPLGIPKPSRPLFSAQLDLSALFSENAYVGISTCNPATLSSHYILGWSFKLDGQAQEFDYVQLAKLIPREKSYRNWTIIHLKCRCVDPRKKSEEHGYFNRSTRILKGKI